mmetsp:Transcript_5303/g.12664  ORF Transcript_5303/g.12664 Transcript_5303/m.12664 type:complete len:345 (-) Transcript_5303:49-1083(-)
MPPKAKAETAPSDGAAAGAAAKLSGLVSNPQLKEFIEKKLIPFLILVSEFVAVNVVPFALRCSAAAQKGWTALQPYHPEHMVEALVGFIICFFGGTFLTLIAAIEAYRMVGWTASLKAGRVLWKNAELAIAASKADDSEDLDGDGQSDVKQLLDAGKVKEVARRKMSVVMIAVNPEEVADALVAVNSGFMAVVATLKLEFAKAITLGNAIGDTIEPTVLRFTEPVAKAAVPEPYHKWVRPTIKYSCKGFAVSIAWTIQRVISAFHSAIRGGLMCSRGVLHYLGKVGVLKLDDKDTYLDEIVGFVLAFLGFSVQFQWGFSLPFPLNLLLLPFSILEWLLMWSVNS